jgi:hypothetical protein
MDAANSKEPFSGTDKPLPKGIWGSVLTTTPIVLTVLATAFAGLSSSEMTQSMYYRSLAAQHQSKAGDQWAFFQVKRTRGTNLEMTVQLLQSLAPGDEFDLTQIDAVCRQMLQRLEQATEAKPTAEAAAKIKRVREAFQALLAEEKTSQSLPYLTGATLPKVEMRALPKKEAQEAIDAVVEAIRQRQTEAATAGLVARVHPEDIEEATRLAEEDADRFDKACEPINETLRQFRALLEELRAAVKPFRPSPLDRTEERSSLAQVPALFDRLNNGFKEWTLGFDARRYRQEASFNRRAAELYEVRVRRSGVASDRHRERSKRFFYSMLLAQAGVTISSLAVARAQHSMLWLMAALAGIVALGFSAYVYLLY